MSWDVMVFRLRERPASIEELTEEMTLPLGAAAAVRETVSAVLGGVDWTDPAWGLYGGDGFPVEFNVGKEDPAQSMMLHVRGGGDAVAGIVKLVAATGWVAPDCSTSEFLDPALPSAAGWARFQRYRDKIARRSSGDAAGEE
jgi:hypothetical protein